MSKSYKARAHLFEEMSSPQRLIKPHFAFPAPTFTPKKAQALGHKYLRLLTLDPLPYTTQYKSYLDFHHQIDMIPDQKPLDLGDDDLDLNTFSPPLRPNQILSTESQNARNQANQAQIFNEMKEKKQFKRLKYIKYAKRVTLDTCRETSSEKFRSTFQRLKGTTAFSICPEQLGTTGAGNLSSILGSLTALKELNLDLS